MDQIDLTLHRLDIALGAPGTWTEVLRDDLDLVVKEVRAHADAEEMLEKEMQEALDQAEIAADLVEAADMRTRDLKRVALEAVIILETLIDGEAR